MVTFPNCKINLGLNVVKKREDGFHNIETVFFPIPLNDVLEIITSEEDSSQFNTTGIFTGRVENNLCAKAFHLLKKDFPGLPQVKMHLHKGIPAGAGLGGGSSDAAFTLTLLNQKYRLNIPEEKLFAYALELGSDCPFFLLNQPSFASGRGEVLEPINVPLSGFTILIINPGIHINTKEIFREVTAVVPEKSIKEIIHQPIASWKNELQNDFENIVFAKYPEIKKIKEDLYRQGALFASMSGTGSTVFGIFNTEEEQRYSIEKSYFHKLITVA